MNNNNDGHKFNPLESDLRFQTVDRKLNFKI
jgi:hypothetical protein